jgi:hypothetical protein
MISYFANPIASESKTVKEGSPEGYGLSLNITCVKCFPLTSKSLSCMLAVNFKVFISSFILLMVSSLIWTI